jgi:Glycosyl-hydrolase 97 C-terminal, oligomerisation
MSQLDIVNWGNLLQERTMQLDRKSTIDVWQRLQPRAGMSPPHIGCRAIGEYVVTARQDRSSADWYLGAITNGEARTLSVPLSFLSKGRRFGAQIYADAPDANWETAPER